MAWVIKPMTDAVVAVVGLMLSDIGFIDRPNLADKKTAAWAAVFRINTITQKLDDNRT